VAESLKCVPRQWKVVEHVREKVSCRHCVGLGLPRSDGQVEGLRGYAAKAAVWTCSRS